MHTDNILTSAADPEEGEVDYASQQRLALSLKPPSLRNNTYDIGPSTPPEHEART